MGEPEILLPQLTLEVTQVDFSSITIGSDQSRPIRIFNTGMGRLEGSLILNQDSSAYSLEPVGAFTLEAGDTLLAVLSFIPSSEASFLGTLLIRSDDPDSSEILIPLSGSGTAALIPVLSFSRESIDFGSILEGETKQEQITFSSTGTDTIVIDTIELTLDIFTLDITLPIVLAPGDEQILTISYQPSSSANHEGEMIIRSNSSLSPQLITLQGRAETPVLYSESVQPVFNANCVGCHGSSGGLNLSSYTQLMSGGNSGAAVIADDSEASRLIQRLRGTVGSQMPLNGAALSNVTISLIETWINQGAHNN